MESCPKPWKCQERKGRSEGEKEDGQLEIEGEKEEEKRKGEDVRICPLEDMRVLLEQKTRRSNERLVFVVAGDS